jgi:hypothetical protein
MWTWFQLLVFKISGTVCDQNPVFRILKHIVALGCFVVFMWSCYARNLLRFFFWYLDSCVLQVNKTLKSRKTYSWFNSIVLKLDLWLIILNYWLFCLLLHKIVMFVFLSFARASSDVIFCVLFVLVAIQCECTMLPFLSYYVFHFFAVTTTTMTTWASTTIIHL